MAFKKTGSPEKIIGIVGYEPKKSKSEKCKHCGFIIAKSNNGIKVVGEVTIIGRAILNCPECGKQITI